MNQPNKGPASTEKAARPKTTRAPAKLRSTPAKAAPPESAAARYDISPPSEPKSLLPSAALLGVGILLESQLLMGIAIGTGLVYASKWLPGAVGESVQPIVNSTITACYSAATKTREMLGEAAQQIEAVIAGKAAREEKVGVVSSRKPEAQGHQPQV